MSCGADLSLDQIDRSVRVAAAAGHLDSLTLLLSQEITRDKCLLAASVSAALCRQMQVGDLYKVSLSIIYFLKHSPQIVQTVLDISPELSPTLIDPVTGLSPLTASARGGDVNIVRRMIEASKGDRLDALKGRDSHGYAALHLAAIHGHVSVVELCLELGCDTDLVTQGEEARGALELAAGEGHGGVVEVLVRRGTGRKERALSAAITAGHTEVSARE